MDVLKVPLTKPPETANGVSVWEWNGSALDEGDDASKWFSNYLGKPSRLVRFNEGRAFIPLIYKHSYGLSCQFVIIYLQV